MTDREILEASAISFEESKQMFDEALDNVLPVLNKRFRWNQTNVDLPCAIAHFRLPWYASSVLLYVCNEHNLKTYTYKGEDYKGVPLSYTDIQKKIQCARKTAQKAIDTLKKMGLLLESTGSGASKNRYMPNVPAIMQELINSVPP